MRSFKIPHKYLDHFLIALDVNFDLPPPDYIFKLTKSYDVVYLGDVIKGKEQQVLDFIYAMVGGDDYHTPPLEPTENLGFLKKSDDLYPYVRQFGWTFWLFWLFYTGLIIYFSFWFFE